MDIYNRSGIFYSWLPPTTSNSLRSWAIFFCPPPCFWILLKAVYGALILAIMRSGSLSLFFVVAWLSTFASLSCPPQHGKLHSLWLGNSDHKLFWPSARFTSTSLDLSIHTYLFNNKHFDYLSILTSRIATLICLNTLAQLTLHILDPTFACCLPEAFSFLALVLNSRYSASGWILLLLFFSDSTLPASGLPSDSTGAIGFCAIETSFFPGTYYCKFRCGLQVLSASWYNANKGTYNSPCHLNSDMVITRPTYRIVSKIVRVNRYLIFNLVFWTFGNQFIYW